MARTRWILGTTRVVSVENRKQRHSWAKEEDGSVTFQEKDLGWWVRVEGSSALYIGTEQPDLKVGDQLRMIVEKIAP